MSDMVKSFKELNLGLQPFAGGKGSILAKMYQKGYPVPEGFIILPTSFEEEKLKEIAWEETKTLLNKIRAKNEGALFAVRSSGLSEDSAQASFAGEFETVLSVKTDKEIQEAISIVFRSRKSERVKAYSVVQGMDHVHQIAVVIQLMVQSEISGVLFTADPITGSHTNMTGNYVYGLGEQLVSGEANSYDFKMIRPKGKYEGPEDFRKYTQGLYKHAVKLEKELGGPQDIEWAISNGNLYILQARPITTLQIGNLDTYEINYSYMGDYLWSNANVAEAISDVVTPFTWSVLKNQDEETGVVPGYYLWGNICGRMYSNISQLVSAGSKSGLEKMGDIFGRLPEEIDIPIFPFSKWGYIKEMVPKVIRYLKKTKAAAKNTSQFLNDTPDWCRGMETKIKQAATANGLLSLWQEEYQPYYYNSVYISMIYAQKMVGIVNKLSNQLKNLVGEEDANMLLSNLREGSELASLGPVVGIAKVSKGEKSKEEYLQQYSHRGPYEFELSEPSPAEDDNWLERQIKELKKSNTDVEGLMKKQYIQHEAAKKRFSDSFPAKVKWLNRQIAKAAEGAYLREATRSEYIRIFRVIRTFALRAGELTDIGDNIFLLYINEVENLLKGDDSALKFIPVRRKHYERYKKLPTFPSIIRGRFNPFEWAKDPNKRLDYYDATLPMGSTPDSETLKGHAGAAGRIEGTVRILLNAEDGNKLRRGEILVASTTNVGWTPLFPRAAAIITDIGAPLSHGAIVARELGIPAVVGCGNATTRLKTGDRVLVDGGQGIVKILG
ncbi:MAG: PEP/pyruvate-binding domain-containing protein [Eubacteriales bacterium]